MDRSSETLILALTAGRSIVAVERTTEGDKWE